MKWQATRIFIVGCLLARIWSGAVASANTNYRWEFDIPADYHLSDDQQIEIANSKARLARHEEAHYDASFDAYFSTNVSASGVHMGPEASMGLRQESGLYLLGGEFKSRVLDRGPGANTWQAFYTRVSNRNLDSENSRWEVSPAQRGVVGLWHLNNTGRDEVSGGIGVLAGGATYVGTAKFGSGSLKTLGVAQRIDAAVNFSLTNAFSVSMWVWAASPGTDSKERPFVLALNNSGGSPIAFFKVGGNGNASSYKVRSLAVQMGVPWVGASTVADTFTTAADAMQWRHLVFTYDQTASPRVNIYKDGVLQTMSFDNLPATLGTIAQVRIGTRYDAYGEGWPGYIDEVVVFNRAIQRDEVQYLGSLGSPVKVQIRSDSSPEPTSNFIGYDGTSNTFFLSEMTLAPTNGFDIQGRYVQYKVFMEPAVDRKTSPMMQAAAFLGDRVNAFDYTLGDYLQGTFVTNVTTYPSKTAWGYVGLGKQANGGYYKQGEFVSRVFDATNPVVWDSILWEKAGAGIANDTAGLVGLWSMDGNWPDLSGKGHPGTTVSVSYTPLAKLGTDSCVFDGASSRVTMSSLGTIKTIEFWVNTEKTDGGILSLVSDGSVNIGIERRYVKTVGFPAGAVIYVNGSSSSSRLVPGWNHVAVTVDSGVAAVSPTVGVVGADYFKGIMDEMAAYNRALTSVEIGQHFVAGRQQIAGRARVQSRASDTLTNLLTKPFVGPGGATNLYYLDETGTRLYVPQDVRYLQYRLFLEGDGGSTPGIGKVTVSYNWTTREELTDSRAEDFGKGTFTGETTQWYGEDMTPVKVAAAGPFNWQLQGNGLEGLWHMDDSSWTAGQTARDSSGNARHGTPAGNAQIAQPAKVGLACGQFDGINSYVNLKQIGQLGSGPFSVMLWFKTSSANRAALISSYDGTSYYALEINSSGGATNDPGKACFLIDDGFGGKKTVVAVRSGLNDGRWHHIAGVRRSPFIQIYIDGDRVGTTEIGSGYGNVGASTELNLAKNGTQNLFYEGFLDEAMIFTRSLSDGEIGEIAAAGYSVTESGVFTGPILDGRQPVVWGRLSWGAHGPSSAPLVSGASSLRGLWHLDGSATNDGSSALNGSGGNFVTGGVFGSCLNLTGSGGVTVPNNAALTPGTLSVEAWVKSAASGARAVVDKQDGSNHGYALGTDSQGRPYFRLSGTEIADALPLNSGTWTHLAGVYDGLTMRLFVDGDARAAVQPVGTIQVATASPLKIGESNIGGAGFVGQIDEVALQSVALSSEEVLDHYRAYAVTLRFQVRVSDDDPPFTGSVPFVGPDGTANTYFARPAGSDMIGIVPTARFFQYRGYLGTIDYRFPPILKGVKVDVYSYSAGNPTVDPVNGFQFDGRLLSLTHLRTYDTNATTDIRYQVTGDSGPSNRWFFWQSSTSQSQWTVVDSFSGGSEYTYQSSPIDVVSSNLPSLFDQYYSTTGGRFRFKAFLHSLGDMPIELDWVDVTVADGRVVITVPNGLEVGDDAWLTGVPYDIAWQHGGRVSGNVKLEYWDDQVLQWFSIASNISALADGYTWTVPVYDLSETDVRKSSIHIQSQQDATVGDYSDSMFEIVKRYHITVPNGGTNQAPWYIGETNRIYWDAAAGLGNVRIDYSGDGTWGSPVPVVGNWPSVAGTRSNFYNWATPFTNAALPSLTAKIRVGQPNVTFADYSDRFFTMAGAAFVRPFSGEKVRRGEPYQLIWNSALCGSLIDIEYQRTPGDPWVPVATNVANADGQNTLDWLVSGSASVDAHLRIRSKSDSRAQGLSPSFTVAAIDIVRPRGAPTAGDTEKFLMGTVEQVGWIAAGASSNVNLRFSPDAGATWLPVASNVLSVQGDVTNWYSWTVPTYPTSRARFQVEDAESPELLARSPYNFYIAGLVVTWPNGPSTQEWVKGVADTVKWSAFAVGVNGTAELSYDTGATWTNVVEGGGPVALGTGESYPPFTPIHPSTSALVRVTADAPPAPFTNIVDYSDFPFTIAGIEVLTPVKDFQSRIGGSNLITFIAAGTHVLPTLIANIEYSSDGGATFDTANPITPQGVSFREGYPGKNENTYLWTIEQTRKPSGNARIRVRAGAYSATSETFTVKGLRFDAPTTATIWDPGTNLIRWSSAGVVAGAAADLYLSIDGGPFTNKLNAASLLIADGSYVWSLTQDIDPSTNAVLHLVVTNSADVGLDAYSPPFTIRGIKVMDPAAGAAWVLGTNQTIRWKAAAAGPFVNLYYSPEGGTTNFDPVPIRLAAASSDGINTFAWQVEKTRMPSVAAQLRIVSNTKVEGMSSVFQMQGIKILRPTSKDIYATSEANNVIQWVAVGDAGPYNLSYVSDGRPPVTIFPSYSGTSYVWPILPEAAGTNVVVTVRGTRYQNESEPFRIVTDATVIINSPRAGAYWQIDGTYRIEWSKGGTMPNDFTVSYLLKPYTSAVVIAAGTNVDYDAANNIYSVSWRVPDVPTQARIQVQHNTLPAIGDLSAEFNLVGQFVVTYPNGGEEFFAARPTEVNWLSRGSVRAVDLYYSVIPPYAGTNWVKINTTPIQNIPAGLALSPNKFTWPVADQLGSSVKLRVQEAAYTNLFDEGQDGPYDDSDDPFTIRYYNIYWRVFDASNMPLNELSVVDSSGWSTTGVSSIDGPIEHDYRWGYWNTVWYRRFYNDAPVLNWNPDSMGRAAWTQNVFMTRSQSEPDFKVLANFTYDFATTRFTTYSWLERGGTLQPSPTKCVITVYDAVGNRIVELTNKDAKGNGVFVTIWDASMLSLRSVYFAKVEIEFAGVTYSSGVTFNLQVTAGEAAIADIIGQAESNILTSLSGVSNEVAGTRVDVQGLRQDLTNLSTFADQATNLLDALVGMTNTMAFVSNSLLSVLGPVTNIDALVSQISQDAESGLARILTRPTTVESNATLSILFKTKRSFGDGAVSISVTPPGSSGATTMRELVGGIYQTDPDLIANWPLGSYTITCTDPAGNADSIIVEVIARGSLTDVPLALTSITNQLASIQTSLYAMTNVNWSAISNVAETVGAITDALYRVDWNALTNVSATLAGVPEGVAALTNRLLGVNWSAITNVSDQMSAITQALGNVQWSDVTNMARDVRIVTNLLGTGSFLTNITSDLKGVATNVEWMAGQFARVDWSGLTNVSGSIGSITSALDRVDWNSLTNIAVNIGSITSSLARVNWDSLTNVSAAVGSITATLSRVNWDSLTNVSADVGSITSALARVNWNALTNVQSDFSTITNALAGLSWGDIRNTISGLSNRLNQVDWQSLTNVSMDVGSITSALAQVNWNSLTNVQATLGQITNAINSVNWNALTNVQSDFSTITNALAGLSWGDIRNTISGLSNRLNQVDWQSLTNVSMDVGSITSALAQVNWNSLTNVQATLGQITNAINSVNWSALTNVQADFSTITNALAGLGWNDIRTTISGLSNRLDQVNWNALTNVSKDVGSITSALARVNWDSLTNVQATLGQITNAIYSVNWAALTNVSQDVSTITNALAGLSWGDIRNTISGLSNRLNQVDWQSLTNVSADIRSITGAIFSVDWAGISNASASISGVSSGVSALTNRLLNVDWAAITDVSSDMAIITGALGNVRWSDVTAIAADVTALRSGLTGVNWANLNNLSAGNNEGLAAEIVGQISSRIGDVASGLAGIENNLKGIGGNAELAARNAQTARTEAGNAAQGVRELAAEINGGDITRILAVVERLSASLARVKEGVGEIAPAVGPERVAGDMENMSKTIEKWAASKGFQWLEEMKEIPAVGGPGSEVPLDKETVGAFIRNFEELQRSLQFLQKLLDKAQSEPLVEEALVGAP